MDHMETLASFEMSVCVGHVGAEDHSVKEFFDRDFRTPLSQAGFNRIESNAKEFVARTSIGTIEN